LLWSIVAVRIGSQERPTVFVPMIHEAQHALNSEATRDRLAFLAQQLPQPPDAKTVAAIPDHVQPPWPKPPNRWVRFALTEGIGQH
jgi:hypothetical protein